MRINFKAALAIVAGLAMAVTQGGAEVVEISVNYQTTPGRSVFATADIPLLGAQQVRRAVKLSPHNYPVWSAELELPPGTAFTVSFYDRADSPAQILDGANGTLIGTTQQVVTPGEALGEKSIVAHVPAGVSQVAVQITSQAPGFGPVTIPFADQGIQGGDRIFVGSVPSEHITMGRDYVLLINGISIFAQPVRLNRAPAWWRHNQMFMEPPSAIVPATPRVETFTFQLSGFRSRTIRVQLPRGYADNPTKRYPVLYAQDGQNVFSPGGAFGSWDLDLTVTSLTRLGEIPEMILVGIDNTQDRFAEYTPECCAVQGTQGRGEEFLTAIRDGLVPEINRRYRTLTDKDNTFHIGSSLGGLIGWVASNDFEDTFGAVIAMSTSFQIGTSQALAQAALPPSSRSRIYIDSGTAGTSADGYANTMAVRDALVRNGHPLGPNFLHRIDYNQSGQTITGHQHNEAAWRVRSPEALRWLYGPIMMKNEDKASRWVVTSARP